MSSVFLQKVDAFTSTTELNQYGFWIRFQRIQKATEIDINASKKTTKTAETTETK